MKHDTRQTIFECRENSRSVEALYTLDASEFLHPMNETPVFTLCTNSPTALGADIADPTHSGRPEMSDCASLPRDDRTLHSGGACEALWHIICESCMRTSPLGAR